MECLSCEELKAIGRMLYAEAASESIDIHYIKGGVKQ
jgi:hypothetical protein